MKKIDKNKDKQANLEDTLEFLSLDDETINSYVRKGNTARQNTGSRRGNNAADIDETYEDEYYNESEDEQYEVEEYEDENYEDEEYEDENYEDEEYEDVEYEDENYEDEEYEDIEYEDENYEDEEDDEDVEYEDENYEDEDYEEEDYEDIEYEYEEYEDEDDEEDEYQGNIFGRIVHFVTHLAPLDYVVVVFGFFILIAAIVVGKVYLSARATDKQVEAFAEIGTDIEDIGIIGESGLIAVANAESVRLSQMLETEEESEEQTEPDSEEESQNNVIEVSINVTSIKSDIKIKFVNKKTNKLIGSVPFEVEVVGSNKTFNLKDDDKDGIIYQTGIDAGTYTVKVVALQEESYSKYSLPSQGMSVKVADTIEYKKVDVEDEIKTEAEINVAVEDTAQQNTEIESVLADTVEWVESTKTELNPDNNYQEINISEIPDPATVAIAAGFMKFTSVGSETVSGNEGENSGDDNVEYKEVKIEGDSALKVGETGKVTGTTSPTSGGAITWSSSDSSIVTVDSDGNLKGIAEGSATITGTCGDAKGTFIVTVTAVTVTYTDLKISGDSTIQAGKTGKVIGTTTPSGGIVTWESSDTSIVIVDSDGNLTGVKEGSAIITGTCGDKKETFNVTVTAAAVAYTDLKISGDSVIRVGKTGKVTGTTTPKGGSITWSSSNTNIVTVDSDGKLTGIAAGEATIKGTCGNNVSAEWKVKVIKDLSGDKTSKLKDKNGAQIYIKTADGKYVEAVYADYYTNAKFYLKKAAAVYFYTGWQTIDGYTYFFDKNGNYVTGEQVIQGAKYSFDSQGRLSAGSGVLGIDVSKWNGSIDWNAVRNSGISYAIIRCGYRGSTTGALIEDPKFRANIQGAQNAGIKVGVYFFTQAVNDVEAVEEASMVLSLIRGYNLALPVFLDVEATSDNKGRADSISVDARTAVCSAFCQTIQNSGYKAGIYANKTWLNSFINTPSLTNYKIWLAQYAAVPSYTRTRIDMWQYSSKGTVSGISGNVDMNISYMN